MLFMTMCCTSWCATNILGSAKSSHLSVTRSRWYATSVDQIDLARNMCILPSRILLLDNVHVSWPPTRISHLCKLNKWSYYFIKFTWISFNLIYMCVFFPRFYEKLTYVFYLLGSVKYLRRKLQSVYLLSSKK
jgi:hypothetical protein